MYCKVINSNRYNLETAVNDWLKTNNYEIINITQTTDNEYITLTIFYLNLSETRKKKISQLNNKTQNK